jgi:hypothetical protein
MMRSFPFTACNEPLLPGEADQSVARTQGF